jgi:hypothetical protein
VLHEFGHALGLPHLHQSPDLSDPFVQEDQARDIIKEHLGLDLAPREILEELKLRWSGRGADERNDWYDVIGEYVARNEPKLRREDLQRMLDQEREDLRSTGQLGTTERAVVAWLASNSVMMGLPVRSIYEGVGFPAYGYRSRLGQIDWDWIKQLYPLPAKQAAP